MGFASLLEERLRRAFRPVRLEIIDESASHSGHAPQFDGSGETHLRVRIVSESFAEMNRLARHRAVNECAGDLFAKGLHALAVEASAPRESGQPR